MSDASRRHGGYSSGDVKWLARAMVDLTNNSWDSAKPVVVCGSGWQRNPNVQDRAVQSLLEAVKVNTSARKLIVRNVSLDLKTQKLLSDFLANSSHLDSIEFHNVRCDGGGMLTVPTDLFRKEGLTEIRLSRCSLSSAACRALGRMVSGRRKGGSLTSLELHKVEFRCDNDRTTGVTFLASALASSRLLQVLKLSDLSLIEEDKNFLLENLSRSVSTTLRILHLEGMSLGEPHARHLARILSNKRSNLEELSFSKNNLNAAAIENLVTRGLVRNSKLRRLILSQNPVGDAGAASLAAGMKRNVALQELRLVDCEIWQSGCSELVSSIPHYAGLTRLSLDGNDFEECVDRLNFVMEANVRFVHVLDSLPRLLHTERRQYRLRGAPSAVCGPYGALDYSLRLNRAGRRFLVEPNLSASLLPRVLERKEANGDPSILYHFLRRSASLYATATAGNKA